MAPEVLTDALLWWAFVYALMIFWLGILVGWLFSLSVQCYRAPVVMIHMEPGK